MLLAPQPPDLPYIVLIVVTNGSEVQEPIPEETSGIGVIQVYNGSNWEDLNDFVSASTGGMFTEKVGIGTIGTTPLYALDVDAKDKGMINYSARFTNSAPDNDLYNIVLFTQGASDTAIGYLGTGGSTVSNSAFKNNFVVGTKNNTPLVLNTNDTERMRIDANGNVGIGTSNLEYPFHLDAADRSKDRIYTAKFENSKTEEDLYNIVLFTQGASDTATGYLGTGGSTVNNSSFRNNFVVGTQNNTPLVLNTNDTEKMRIDTIGRVGIGTSNLEYPFHLDAADRSKDRIYTAKFENSKTEEDLYNIVLFTQGASDTATGYLGTGGSTVNNSSFRNNFVVGTQNNTPLVLNTNDTEKMRIDTIGRVGIGTSNLEYPFHLDAADRSKDRIYTAKFENSKTEEDLYNIVLFTQGASDTATGYLGTGGSTVNNSSFKNNFVVGTQNNTPLVLNTNDTERMRIDTIGRVGIGTSNLEYPFHLDAADRSKDRIYTAKFENSKTEEDLYNIVLFTQGASDTATGYLGTGGSTVNNSSFKNNFVVGTQNNTPLVLNTNDTERMRIDANGNVGIGSNCDPNYKLKVNGEISANNWTSDSDRRWKKDIKTLDNSLDKIAALRGVSYQWRVDDFPNKNFSDGTQLGVIAQEIETVFPELVHTDKKGYKSVQYSNIVAPLIEAIKTLKHQNEAQQDQITSLIERVKALEDK